MGKPVGRAVAREIVVPRKVSPVIWFPTILQRLLERTFSDEKLEWLAKAARRVAAENVRRREAASRAGDAGVFV